MIFVNGTPCVLSYELIEFSQAFQKYITYFKEYVKFYLFFDSSI